MRPYKLDDTREIPLIEFSLGTPDGATHTFRATRRPPLDVLQAWFAVRIGQDGKKNFHVATLIEALQRLVVDKIWVPGTEAENGTEAVEAHWQPVDDRDRLMELVAGEGPYALAHTELGALVMDLLDEATANPTGAPN